MHDMYDATRNQNKFQKSVKTTNRIRRNSFAVLGHYTKTKETSHGSFVEKNGKKISTPKKKNDILQSSRMMEFVKEYREKTIEIGENRKYE